MGKFGIEARVGAFVLAALALLVGFVLALGDFSLSPGIRLHADFAYTSTLQVGAPVMLSGVRVGRVTDLALLGEAPDPPAASPRESFGQRAAPLVRADLRVDAASIRLFSDDTTLHIGTQGVIGETYIEVTPGDGEPLAAGAVLRGVDAPRLHVMALQISGLLSAMDGLFMGGSDLDLGAVGQSLTSLLDTLGGVLGERREELSRILIDLAAATTDLREILAQVRRVVDDGHVIEGSLSNAAGLLSDLRAEVPPLLADAKRGLASLESLSNKADGALDAEAIAAILADVRRTTERLDALTQDAQAIVRTIKRGEGTVGGFLQDPQIYDDVKEMLRDLKRNPWKIVWRD